MSILAPYIEYFSQFENLPNQPTSSNLGNAIIIYDLLSRIQSFPILQINPNPQTFADIFSNIKTLSKGIETYWTQTLAKEIETDEIDLVQIAKNNKQEELVKLGQLFVRTAIQSQNQQYFIEKILKTCPQTQQIFMGIIEIAIGNKNKDSPRKEKEKRLYDKLIQLDHQNDKLQQLVGQICNDKLEIENKFKKVVNILQEKDKQIQKLNRMLGDILQTNKKPQIQVTQDTNQNNNELAEKLKNKMIQMTKQHQKQITKYKEEIQFFSNKMERLTELESILEDYKEKIHDANRAMNKVDNLQNTIRDNIVVLREKDVCIDQLNGKIQKMKGRLLQFEERQMEYRLELQRKSVKIQELMKYQDRKNSRQQSYLTSSLSIQKTLSQQCPQIMISQTMSLTQSNKTLRYQLERTIKALKSSEVEVQKYKGIVESYGNLEEQNKKLTKILKTLTTDRGQENQILMGCLYQMRIKFKELSKHQKQISRPILTHRFIN